MNLQPSVPIIFDRHKVRERRSKPYTFQGWFELLDLMAERLKERLSFEKRQVTRVLQIGWDGGCLLHRLESIYPYIQWIVLEESFSFFHEKYYESSQSFEIVIGDLESIPLSSEFDLILSTGVWQWVNDLPGVLAQCQSLLSSNGLLLCAFMGGDSLWELKTLFQKIDEEHRGGTVVRFDPLVHARSLAALFQRAGFLDPVTDVDHIKLTYSSVFKLFQEFSQNGISCFLKDRFIGPLHRQELRELEAEYDKQFGEVRLSLDILFGAGRGGNSTHFPSLSQVPLKQIPSQGAVTDLE